MPLSGDIVNPSDVVRQAGYTVSTSDVAATSGGTEVAVDTILAQVVAGRTYKIEAFFPYTGSVLNDRFFVLLREGTTIAGTQLTYATVVITQTASRVEVTRPAVYWTAGSTGAQSFCVCVRRADGTGALTPRGSGGQPRWLVAEYAA